MKNYLLALAAILLTGIAPASADVLAQWDISASGKNDRSLSGDSLDINISVSDIITEGVHLRSGKGSDGQFSAKHWSVFDDPNKSMYYEFSVTASGQSAVTLNELSVPLAREMDCIKFTRGAEKWQLSASLDGFSSSALYNSTVDISQSYDRQVVASSFDLNNTIIQSGQTMTFRLYGYGGTFWNNYAGLYSDNNLGLTSVELLGQSGAVPEPATAAILLVGAVYILRKNRKNRPTS